MDRVDRGLSAPGPLGTGHPVSGPSVRTDYRRSFCTKHPSGPSFWTQDLLIRTERSLSRGRCAGKTYTMTGWRGHELGTSKGSLQIEDIMSVLLHLLLRHSFIVVGEAMVLRPKMSLLVVAALVCIVVVNVGKIVIHIIRLFNLSLAQLLLVLFKPSLLGGPLAGMLL